MAVQPGESIVLDLNQPTGRKVVSPADMTIVADDDPVVPPVSAVGVQPGVFREYCIAADRDVVTAEYLSARIDIAVSADIPSPESAREPGSLCSNSQQRPPIRPWEPIEQFPFCLLDKGLHLAAPFGYA